MLTTLPEYVHDMCFTIQIFAYTNGIDVENCFSSNCICDCYTSENFAQDKDQRSMDMETARAMLQLLLGKHWPLFTQFAQFLEQSKYKVINKDQWCNILEFSRTINHDLSNYDLDGACKWK